MMEMSTSSSSSTAKSRLALPKALTLLFTVLGLSQSFRLPRSTTTYNSPPVFPRSRITSATSTECRDTRLWSERDEGSTSLDEKGVPRLHLDLVSLIRWIEQSGGVFEAEVGKNDEGWSLYAKDRVEAGTVLLKIPKSLCIYANPSLNVVPLVDNVKQLMSSLDSSQWRARLAVALLSERVRSISHFRAYLRNLPFEFWGVPVFYSSQEFSIMQDLALMQRTRDRCRFLSEFAVSVLAPLHNTPRDPFSKHCADVNAFGWGFASAASRALRHPDVIQREDGHVMVPGIDIAEHSCTPTCEVINSDEHGMFLLRTLKTIEPGGALTIDYGPLSNDELFADYGFTIDENPHDRVKMTCDANLINTARMVMGQCNLDDDLLVHKSSNNNNHTVIAAASAAVIGRGGQRLDDWHLFKWQIYWLTALNLHGPNANYAMQIGSDVSSVDPRLWAFLRILYAKNEEEITRHGYTPFTLQHAGSVLSAEIEMQVLKTMVGIVGVMLRVYGTELETDMTILRTGKINYDDESKVAGGMSMLTVSSDDIISEVHRILRTILRMQSPHPSVSATINQRRINAAALAALADEGSESDVQSFRDGIASADTPYRIAIGGGGVSGGKTTSSEWSPSNVMDSGSNSGTSDNSSDYNSDNDSSLEATIRDMANGRTVSNRVSSKADDALPLTNNNNIQEPATSSPAADSPESTSSSSSSSTGATPTTRSARVRTTIPPELNIDISTLGTGLPINVREALRYRIRKKRSLAHLAIALGDLYSDVQPVSSSSISSYDSSSTRNGNGQNGSLHHSNNDMMMMQDGLLPAIANMDRVERRARIRELLDEVRGREDHGDDLMVTANKIASKWSEKGLEL